MLKFNIRHQSISRVDHFRPVEKSVKYLKARFLFLTDEWDEYEKRCLCRREGQTYEKDIIDGECEIPWEVLLGGPFELCAVGKSGDTTVPTAAVEIDLGVTLPGGPKGAEPTPSQYDELKKRIDALADTAVLYTEQSLTDEQRAQARRNIGADGLDWHETEPGSAYTTYIANVGINNGITDWDKVLSFKGGASGDQAVLANAAQSVSSLLDGSSKSINKANFVNLFLSNIGVLVDSGCITLPWGFAFAVNETAQKVGKISYCKVQSQSNGIWALFNLENNKYFMIKADGTYIDNTAVYPDDTLTKSNRAADAKAVGDALALKADKTDIVKPDWNAKEGEAGHVLNRTHCDEIVDVVHVEPTTGVFTWFDGEGNPIEYIGKAEPVDYGIYTVMYDGTPYVVKLEDKAITVDGEVTLLHAAGNVKLAANAFESLGMSVEPVEDSGEPFFVSAYTPSVSLQAEYYWTILSEDSNEHTISITGQTRKLVKLPSKYAPVEDIQELPNNTAVAGQVCKFNPVSQVERCNVGDVFCGFVKEIVTSKIRGERAVVQLGGYVTVPFRGSTIPTGFTKLSSDGEGGVKLDETGREYLVLDVNNNNYTVTLRL